MKLATSPRVSLGGLGFATAVAQAVLLREAMAAVGGSELAWGAVLALWLLGMGLGSWMASGARRPGLGEAGPAALLLAAGLGVVLLRAAPALAGSVAGEALGAWRVAGVWALAVAPAAVLGGVSFPLLAAALAGREVAGAAYALESAGALVGGVAFTFLLAPWGSSATVVVSFALVVAVSQLSRGRWLLAIVALAGGVVAVGPASDGLARTSWRWGGRVGPLAAWRETRSQRLELSGASPSAVYADGKLLGSFPDPYRIVPRAHLLMLLHPQPREVLAVGAATDGSLPVLLQHPLARLDVVEDDPALLEVLPEWWGQPIASALADRRVEVHRSDPLQVISRGEAWDLILLLDADPGTLRHNRTRTREFFARCADRLKPGGVLVVRVGASDTYLGGAAGHLLGVLASTLKEVFPAVVGVPGEETLLVATRPPATPVVDPLVLSERWRERGVEEELFVPEALELLLDPQRGESLDAFLASATGPVNTVMSPRAVLAAAALREGRVSPPFLALLRGVAAARWVWFLAAGAVLLVAVAVVSRGGAGRGVLAGAVVGFSSMGWWLLLLAAWQATVGSVYAQVGALSAAFMAGLAGGAAWAMRWRLRPARALPTVLVAGSALSALLVLAPQVHWPRAMVVPLLLVAGALTGAAFPGIAWHAGHDLEVRGAGRGFAADEVGAGLAAAVIGLVALPLAGMRVVAGSLAIMQVLTAALLVVGGGNGRPGHGRERDE